MPSTPLLLPLQSQKATLQQQQQRVLGKEVPDVEMKCLLR